jgi:hypothetical protein
VAPAGPPRGPGTADFPGGVRVSTMGIGQVSLRPPG